MRCMSGQMHKIDLLQVDLPWTAPAARASFMATSAASNTGAQTTGSMRWMLTGDDPAERSAPDDHDAHIGLAAAAAFSSGTDMTVIDEGLQTCCLEQLE